jgi:hypothetical protein
MQTQLEQIEKGAENNISEMRFIENIEIGQFVRQGDIYIHRVHDDHPCGDVTENRQLAFGTTRGSRHILEGDAEVYLGMTAPEWAKRALLGPMFKLFRRGTVTHPEHAHISLPAGTYQVTHQMDARTLQRVRD